jgi:hypothetical protein
MGIAKILKVIGLALILQAQAAFAIEIFNQDFESLTNCTTGREDQCWIDNDFVTGNAATFARGKIKNDAQMRGNGYFEIQHPFGGTSTGRVNIDTTDATTVTWGHFIRFSDDYMFYSQTHGVGMRITGDSGCDLGGNTEFGNDPAYYMFNNGSCGFSNAVDLIANQTGRTVFKGNRKYWVVQQIKIDTSCTDSSSQTGCNGEYRMWIDGTLVSEHTNRNFAGVLRNATVSTFAYEWYYHVGFPGHAGVTPTVWIDDLIIRNDDTYITMPSLTQGTANTTPYFIWHAANNFVAHQFNDCTLSSFTNQRGFNYGSVWRTNGNATSQTATPNGNNEYPPDPTECASAAAATDAYMEVATATGDGGGVSFGRPAYYTGTGSPSYYQNWLIHGWIYLEPGNDYGNVLLSGFRSYNCYSGCCDGSCAPWARVIAVSVNSGNWAIAYRSDTATSTYYTSTTAITEGAWVEFELWHDKTNELAQLRIDGNIVRVADLTGMPQSIMQDPGGDGGGGVVVGVIDYIGTGTFTVRYDDVSVGSASFSSCDGWDGDDCPFSFPGTADQRDPLFSDYFRYLKVKI